MRYFGLRLHPPDLIVGFSLAGSRGCAGITKTPRRDLTPSLDCHVGDGHGGKWESELLVFCVVCGVWCVCVCVCVCVLCVCLRPAICDWWCVGCASQIRFATSWAILVIPIRSIV